MRQLLTHESWLWLGICGIVLIVILQIFKQIIRDNKDVELQNLMSGKSRYEHLKLSQRMRNHLLTQPWYVRYEEFVSDLLEKTYDKSWTLDSMFRFQSFVAVFTIVGTLFSLLVARVVIFIIGIPLVGLLLFALPILLLRSKWSSRQETFDENLPQFINHMCLAFDSGAGISKAMSLTIQTMEDDIRQDFDKLLVDYQMHMDDPSLPFERLAQRMPTKECKRFCNVTSTGLKNGNQMRAIFQKEADYMIEEYKTKLQESAKKKQNIADAISTLFIFLPIVIIMVAPMVIGNL